MNEKFEVLRYLDTKSLITRLHELEDEFEKVMKEEAEFKTQNYGYLGSECAEVKRIEAELTVQAEGTNENQRKAWLLRQRVENDELLMALTRQKTVAFDLENIHIRVEMTKRRLESTKAVLALKTAQIHFLSGEDAEPK